MKANPMVSRNWGSACWWNRARNQRCMTTPITVTARPPARMARRKLWVQCMTERPT